MKVSAGYWKAAAAVVMLSLGLVSGAIVAKDINIKVVDRTGDPLFSQQLEYPTTFDKVPKVKSTTPLSISFKAEAADKPLQLDQALVSFQHTTTGNEVALPAKAMGKSGVFKMEITRKQFRTHFESAPGQYNVALVLGSYAEGGLLYKLGDVHMAVGTSKTQSSVASPVYGPKEEIRHRFAEPQRMPNVVVSLVFSCAVVVPLVVLLGAWAKLGVNVDNLQREAAGSIAFLGLVAAYVGLAVAYWVGVKLFPTLAYALVLALPTFVTGRYALSKRIQKGI
ncbi:proteasome regulatory particle base subunit [Coemansia furcata]|uniref:Proteasome regulatory particle base subunit n=1 Tax=Coemansia furcata TaxID=417177 RepID=A0ACC1L4X7_9FUNG|nr:proteasome regulatory particle base subunit [Coemansia furcata]